MKRTWKRWGALLLAVVMTLSLLPVAALAAAAPTLTAPVGCTIYTPSASELSVNCVQGDSGSASFGVDMMVDGQADTFWTAAWSTTNDGGVKSGTIPTASTNNYIRVSLSEAKKVKGFYYLPRPNSASGTFQGWKVQTSTNGTDWSDLTGAMGTFAVASGEAADWHYAELTQAVNTQYIALVPTSQVNNVIGSCAEIRLVVEEQGAVTQYVRQTGEIEPGIYLIHSSVDNGTNLHANSNATTTQCGDPDPQGDTLGTNHVNDDNWPATAHQWAITAVEGGYTIRSVSTAKYLSATPSGNNLSLLDNSTTFSITPAEGGGYAVSYNGAALRFSTSPRGWNLSTDGGVVQLFKKTVTDFNTLTIDAVDDGSHDVGANESGTYSNDPKVIHAWACSQQSGGPAINAVDGSTGTNWHSRWNGNQTDEENTDPNTTDQVGWGQGSMPASMERRWIELDITEEGGGAQWLSGLRYYGDGNGRVVACEIRVWDETAGAWVKVTSDTVWTIGNGTGWSYKEFDYPVQTSKVRLYGATTASASGTNANMSAKEIRLVKALTEPTPATQTVTVTVKDAENNPIEGATVNDKFTTDENGQATLTLMDGMAYTLTVAKEGYKPRTVKVQTDGADLAVEVTLHAPLNLVATDATYDYPLTDTMVSAVSAHDNDGTNSDGHANWAIDYENHWWHQFYNRPEDVWFAFSLPAQVAIAGIRYQQREQSDGSFGNYEIQTSTDGTTWTTLADEVGTWGNDHDIHVHELEEPQTARYFRVHRTNGNAQNRTAKLFQLVLAPEGRTTVTGKVTKDGSEMPNVTIKVYQGEGEGKVATYKTATTNNNGEYSIVLPKDGQSWTLVTDSLGNKPASYTLTTSDPADTHNFALEARELHLTGIAPAGTTVQLMQGAGRIPVEGVAAQTGTSFNFDVSNLAAGTYYLRAWKDGCVPAWKTVTWEATTEELNPVTVAGSDLVPVDTSSAYKSYDFSNNTQVSEFVSLYGSADGTATHDSENGAMTLTFSGDGNDHMWVNAVGSKNYVLKNGTISFDVTQTAGDVNGRFGLVFLQFNGDGEEAWAFIGEMDNASRYFAENAKVGGGDSGYGGAEDGPAMVVGVPRHFEVTVNGTNLALKIDGLTVTNWDTNAATAGYWGFTQNKQNTSYRIDNLVVTRADTESAVTLSALMREEGAETPTPTTAETLTAAIVTPYNTTGTTLTSGGNAYAGDTVKITGSNTSGVLYQVTVNDSAEGVTRTEVEGGYTFTFTMPAEDVTVAGTFAPNIPAFTVSGADASGNISAGTYVGSTFTGNTLTIDGDLANDEGATIEWYKKTGNGAWTKIDSATDSSYTIQEGDYNEGTTTKLKVKVSGNGAHHAGWKESGEFTVTAPVYAVNSVTLQRTALTMWSNYAPTPTSEEFPTEVGSSATLTATVGPEDVDIANAQISWKSTKTSLVTVTPNATDPTQATLTVLPAGVSATAAENTATITVSVAAGGATKTATCVVTVKTKAESITVNGLTNNKVIVYTNDNEDSIDVTATVSPATANDKTLVWTRPASGSSLIKIDRKSGTAPEGEGDDKAESSGAGVTITAVGEETNVGQVTVTVKAKSAQTVTQTFIVEVRHKLAEDHNITIANDAKVGTTLTVNTGELIMTTAGKNALTYKWYRLDAADAEITEEMTAISTEKEYTLQSADKDKYIAVVVTAAESTYYEGTKKAVTAKVELANGPTTAPTLTSTPYSKDQDDIITYGTIAITNPVAGETYEYRKKTSGADASEETWSDWQDVTASVADDKITITDLVDGNYQVRIKANDLHKAGTAGTVTVRDATKTYYSVTATMDPTEGAGTVELDKESVEQGQSVTLTVTPADAYNITSVTHGTETLTGTAGENGAMEYTVSDVQADVAFAVTFTKKQVTITLALTNLTATCDADVSHTGNDTHTVDYGTVETITLTPANGYELPKSITVTYTDGTDVPTTRCEYDNESGEITFSNGVQRNITITAKATQKKYSVQLADDDGVLSLTGAAEVNHNATYTGTLSVSNATQYALPETITVTMGTTELTVGTGYTYNKDTGVIEISNVTDNVTITATAEENKTTIEGVTIEIDHRDSTGMGTGSQNVPHVGDILTATVEPTGATVTYQWVVSGSETVRGSGQTFTVPSEEGIVGKTIKVTVTGTGTYDGTAYDTTAAVGEKSWKVTGVSVDESITLEFQGEATLTATVTPATASNKNVTWSSSNTSVATVDANGKVTAVGKGTATITVTTADGGKTATCAVTVTAKALPELKITKPQVDQTASVSFVGGVSTSVATYEWYTGEITDPNATTGWNRVADVSGDSWLVTGIPSGRYIKVVAIAKSTGNYTGSYTVVSDAILSNEVVVTKYAITTTKTGDGTVTVKVNDAEATEAAESHTVTIEVTDVVAGATVEVTSTTEGVTLTKGADNIWTFTMPAEEVAITVTITEPVVEKYAITVSGAENGTVTANKTEAAAGQTVTLTVTPAEGYKLDTLTATGISGAVTVTEDNTFVMPAEAVTVTATFVEDTTPPDISELAAAITAAMNAKKNVEVADNAEDVLTSKKFVSQEVMDAFEKAIADAKAAKDAEDKTAESVAAAVEALNAAVAVFEEACQPGTKKIVEPPVIVATPTENTETKEDGTKVTTEIKEDGTKTETTEKPDGTKEIVETKPDGTKTETVEKPDGTKESVETKLDGTVTETVEKPDGTKEAVETKPDGTVTETKTDADGAKVEKVTDPEENVTITATDAEGETVAEVKVPATIPETEKRFEDVPVDHWADKAIHKLAAIEVINGVTETKYSPVAPMKRGDLATVLFRMSNGKKGLTDTFEDVESGKYYADGIAWAAKAGVVQGYSETEFRPEQVITREQLALMLMRYAKLLGMDTSANATELAKFADGGKTSSWAVDGVAWCVKVGILQGMDATTLSPNTNVSRAQVAVMFQRFLDLVK